MNREQIIRDTAYAIWEAEGRPQGRDRDHWSEAERQITHIASTAQPANVGDEAAARVAKAAPRKRPLRSKPA